MSLLVARPKNMSYEEYCRQRKEQNLRLKQILKKGRIVFLSKVRGFKGMTYVKPKEEN